MEVFGVDSVLAEELGVKHTSQEICQQPELWHEVYDVIKNQKKELQAYLEGAYADVDKIILTGAGTSAFIGLSARRSFHNQVGIETQAIATTDLVTHYRDFVQKQESVLLVSFARSGDSPESIAAVEHMSSYVKKCYNLIITCNEGGQLMRMNAEIDNYCVLLPSKSNDQSLAMTSSYTSMLLAGLLVSRIKEIEAVERQVNLISHYASEVINKQAPKLQEIARLSFDRAVFLGSGPFSGSAKEAHLKVQELTNGIVVCKHDSYLGLRHGPKVVIKQNSLVVYFLSEDKYARQYELDLINSIDRGQNPIAEIIISYGSVPPLNKGYEISFGDREDHIDEDFLTVCYIVPIQILGFYKALDCNLNPDSPSKNGTINRVVQGVNIYSQDK